MLFLGDGAMAEGAVYEALNLATIYEAPILFAVEDNGIAQSTETAGFIGGDFAQRFASFGIQCVTVDHGTIEERLPRGARRGWRTL